MKRHRVNVCPYLRERTTVLRIVRVATIRFDHDPETFTGLALRNVAEPVGAVGGFAYVWQIPLADPGAALFPECTSGARGTQGHDKFVVVQIPVNGHGVVTLQNISVVSDVA